MQYMINRGTIFE